MALAATFAACNDDVSNIGNSLTDGDVTIYVDSLTFNLEAKGVESDNYDSRSGNLLLGSINVPDYGVLKSSFVARMMCATKLNVPDTLTVDYIDSCKMVLAMYRGDIVGDSVAPQRVNVYRLNDQIPDNITNTFNPREDLGAGALSLLGERSFTFSAMGVNDSTFFSRKVLYIDVPIEKQFAIDVFNEYKEKPSTFEWPQSFAKDFLPGIFVESSFGRGCVANIQGVYFSIFYHTVQKKTETVDEQEVVSYTTSNDTVSPFSISPEVLSSNNISYNVAQEIRDKIKAGEIIITTPGGYNARFKFPAEEVKKEYLNQEHNLSVISDLTLTIPAEAIANDYGIDVAPNLLLVKTSDLANFFTDNKIPDGVTSITSTYDTDKKQYVFSSLREYFIELLKKDSITEDDTDFSLVPVSLGSTSQTDYYGNEVTYVTKCLPYTIKPTMTRLHTDKALVVFSFSSRVLE